MSKCRWYFYDEGGYYESDCGHSVEEEDFDNIAEGNEEWSNMMKDFYKDFHPKVEDVAANAERESGERILGKDPQTGRQVSVRLGKFGPIAQIGAPEDEEKQFASLNKDQNLGTISMEEALELFLLPKAKILLKKQEKKL